MAAGGYAIVGRQAEAPRDPRPGECAVTAARMVLNTPDPVEKARRTAVARDLLKAGELKLRPDADAAVACPDRPARPDDVAQVLDPRAVPRRKKKNIRGTEARLMMLHSIAHIESWAIDLSWDMLARFGPSRNMPEDFYRDWVRVAVEEADHFSRLRQRLLDEGKDYGSYPVHDGLWESAHRTKDSVLSRLAVEHCVHEARGLDVMPNTLAKFKDADDQLTFDLLNDIIYPEEITHCGAGVTWFRYMHGRVAEARSEDASAPWFDDERHAMQADRLPDDPEAAVRAAFRNCVRTYFYGSLRPPFNDVARDKAGLPRDWYDPPPTADEGAA